MYRNNFNQSNLLDNLRIWVFDQPLRSFTKLWWLQNISQLLTLLNENIVKLFNFY